MSQLHKICSDLDAAAIVDIVKDINDPSDAARVLVMKSAALWAENNDCKYFRHHTNDA